MSTKLTLTIEKSVIEEAKKYAKSQGRSLSKLIEEYLKSVSREDQKVEELQLSPITKSLYGSVKLDSDEIDYKEILKDEILKKHLYNWQKLEMKTIFLDTNVVLDFVLKRKGFAEEAAIIFDLGERKKLRLLLSSLSMNNIDYIVSKIESKKKSRQIILKLLSLVDVFKVDRLTIEKAALSNFKDFEDAIQNYCAEEGGVNHIITQNLKDFKESELSIQTPKEFLVSFDLIDS